MGTGERHSIETCLAIRAAAVSQWYCGGGCGQEKGLHRKGPGTGARPDPDNPGAGGRGKLI